MAEDIVKFLKDRTYPWTKMGFNKSWAMRRVIVVNQAVGRGMTVAHTRWSVNDILMDIAVFWWGTGYSDG